MITLQNFMATALLTSSIFIFNACVRKDINSMSFCELIGSPTQYDHQRIELRASVIAEPHGYHLVSRECVGSSVELLIPGHSDNSAKFTELMRQVMAHRAKGDLIITGTFHVTRINNQIGSFVVDDVLKVVTGDANQ